MSELQIPAEALRAHLEALEREGSPVGLITGTGLELAARIRAVEADRARLRVEVADLPPRTLKPGDALRLALPLGRQRWESPTRVMEQLAHGTFVLALPREAERRDRRIAPRIPILADSGLRAMVSLGPQGPALSGPLLDLSTGGFRFQVERAFDLQTRERLVPDKLGLASGLALDGVELTGLREEPLEAGGLLRDVDPGPVLHVQFRALLRADRAWLQAWCGARCGEATLPPLPEPVAPRLPLLLWMDAGPAQEALQGLLEASHEGPVACVGSLSDLRGALQHQRHRTALLLGPAPELPQAIALVRALRGGRPCPIVAPEGAAGCDRTLAQPLTSAALLAVLREV